LTLEGLARTMRGVPALVAVTHSSGDWRTRRETIGLAVVLAGAAARYGGDRSGRSPGCRARQPTRLVGFRPKGAAKAAAPQRRDPRVNPGRLRRVTLAAHPSRLLAPVLAVHGQGRQAWRAAGAPLKPFVEKVVTAPSDALRARLRARHLRAPPGTRGPMRDTRPGRRLTQGSGHESCRSQLAVLPGQPMSSSKAY